MENWYTDLTLPIRCGISNDIKNMKCKTVVKLQLLLHNNCMYSSFCWGGKEEEKKLFDWDELGETEKKQDWSYSISYQHYRQYHFLSWSSYHAQD